MEGWDPLLVREVSHEAVRSGGVRVGSEEASVALLAVTLPRLRSFVLLSSLHLASCNLCHAAIELVTTTLADLPSLRTLNLCGNELQDDSVATLAGALRNAPSLSKLDLSVNQISNEGAESLAEALMPNTSLSVLNLINNTIRDRGARAFYPVLERSVQSLRRLYFNGNAGISPATVERFREIEDSCSFSWEEERILWIGCEKNGASCLFSRAGGMPPGVMRLIMMFSDRHVKASFS